ncbi:MAG: nitroreductase [Candidatus Sericytochromatia bacterium]|nr:nitroreductase [Candidatus Sericytochromatia bacterium]
MTIHELIASRRTTFQFQDRPVPDALIQRALEAARWAPNHKLTEPWRFIVPGPVMSRRLAEHFASRLGAKLQAKGIDEADIAAKQAAFLAGPASRPPCQMVVYTIREGNERQQKEDFAATCCAVENLMLAAWSEGVASGWKSFDDPTAYALCDLDPTLVQIVGLFQLGYPLHERQSQRQPINEKIIRTA